MIDINIEKDYYKILGVRRSANTRQIQQAYQKRYKQPFSLNKEEFSSLRDYFLNLERALEALTDINKRSTYDAHWTYNFLKNYAWDNQLLTDNDLKHLKRFWSRLHLNREVYSSLNFDNFTPEYDLKWYIPFYQEAFWQDVKKKEKSYYKSIFHYYTNRYWFLAALFLGFVGVVASITFMNYLGLVLAVLIMLASAGLVYWSARNFFIAWTFKQEDKTIEDGLIVDKWVKLRPRLLLPKYKPVYYIAYKTDYGTFYQRVNQNIFNRLKLGMPVDVLVSLINPAKSMISKSFIEFLEKKSTKG